MALGTPQGVKFFKASRYYIPKTYNNNDREEEAKEAKMEKKQTKA